MSQDEEYDEDNYDDDVDELEKGVDEMDGDSDNDVVDEEVDEADDDNDVVDEEVDEADDDNDVVDEEVDEADDDNDVVDEEVDEADDDNDVVDEEIDEAVDDNDVADEEIDEAVDDNDVADEEVDEAVDDDKVDDEVDEADPELVFDQDRVFVIMHYKGEESDEVFSAINEECSLLGLDAEIAKDMAGSGLVVQEIYTAISQAEYIVCDLTGERPNVYYELGQAHALGNNALRILLIAKEGTTVHYDISPFRVHFYESAEHLRPIVRTELIKMMNLTR